jgi:hypothetical protein
MFFFLRILFLLANRQQHNIAAIQKPHSQRVRKTGKMQVCERESGGWKKMSIPATSGGGEHSQQNERKVAANNGVAQFARRKMSCHATWPFRPILLMISPRVRTPTPGLSLASF